MQAFDSATESLAARDPIEPCFGRLYGRADVLNRLTALIADPDERLITVTGVAGVGKSHLAQVAAAHAERDRGVVRRLADLADAADERAVWSCLGAATAAEAARLIGSARVLLLLDNCDRVIRAVAPAVAALLRACPHLTVLVTSRASLELRAERVFVVPPLPTGPGSAAEDLFVNLVRPHYRMVVSTASGRRAVTQICALADGVPLALALAAEAVTARGLMPVLQRLRDGDYPGSWRMRDAPARHRSARHAVAWSDDLVSPADRALLCRLSVYQSAIDLDAVTAAGTSEPVTMSTLESLLQRSLLTAGQGHHGEPEFRVPHMVRSYYYRELARSPAALRDALDRHAERMLDFAAVTARAHRDGEPRPRLRRAIQARLPDLLRCVEYLRCIGATAEALRLLIDLEEASLGHGPAPDADTVRGTTDHADRTNDLHGHLLYASLSRRPIAHARSAYGEPDAGQDGGFTIGCVPARPAEPVVWATLLTALAGIRCVLGQTSAAHETVREAMRLLLPAGQPDSTAEVRAMADSGTAAVPDAVPISDGAKAQPLSDTAVPQPMSGAAQAPPATGTGGTAHRMPDHEPAPLREALPSGRSAPSPDVSVATAAETAYGLTPRQHQIALLVAEGLTNRQIARQLEISEWTVINHLRVVMQKLGCASRVHVVRAMQRPVHVRS